MLLGCVLQLKRLFERTSRTKAAAWDEQLLEYLQVLIVFLESLCVHDSGAFYVSLQLRPASRLPVPSLILRQKPCPSQQAK